MKGVELPVDTLSIKYKPRLDRIKIKHDKIKDEYNKLVSEYSEIVSEARSRLIMANKDYVYAGGCRHHNYVWKRDDWKCPDCRQELRGKNNWFDAHLTEKQEQRFMRLQDAIWKIYPEFSSFDCDHDFCC